MSVSTTASPVSHVQAHGTDPFEVCCLLTPRASEEVRAARRLRASLFQAQHPHSTHTTRANTATPTMRKIAGQACCANQGLCCAFQLFHNPSRTSCKLHGTQFARSTNRAQCDATHGITISYVSFRTSRSRVRPSGRHCDLTRVFGTVVTELNVDCVRPAPTGKDPLRPLTRAPSQEGPLWHCSAA